MMHAALATYPIQVLLFTTFLASALPVLSSPRPVSTATNSLALVLASTESIALPESVNTPLLPSQRSPPSPDESHPITIFGVSSSSWPFGSQPGPPVGTFSSTDQPPATETNTNTNSMSSNLRLEQIYIENQDADVRRLLDLALEREMAAQEIASEADGYAGLPPGVLESVKAERMRRRR